MSSTTQEPPKGNRQETLEPAPKRPSRRRNILILIAIVAAIAGLVWLVHWWTVGRFIESTNDAYLQADSMTAAPKVSGYVTDVYVRDNQSVKAGDPLVKLDVRQYQVSLQNSQASVDARRADIARTQADIAQQRANLEQAQAQAQVSSINLKHASEEYARYAPLAATGAETHERIADLKNTRDQAQATLAANNASIAAARAQINSSTAQLQQAQAQLEAAQASAAQSQLDLDNSVVRSTLDGRVGDRTVRRRPVRAARHAPLDGGAGAGHLPGRQLQGNPGGPHAGGPAGHAARGRRCPIARCTARSTASRRGTGSQFALLPPDNATGNFTKIVQRVPVRIHVDTDDETRRVLLPGLSVDVDVDTRDDGQHHG